MGSPIASNLFRSRKMVRLDTPNNVASSLTVSRFVEDCINENIFIIRSVELRSFICVVSTSQLPYPDKMDPPRCLG